MTIERSITVLERTASTLHGQRFEHADGYDPGRVAELPQHVWEDLGRPEVITVAVWPGDVLNNIDHPYFTRL